MNIKITKENQLEYLSKETISNIIYKVNCEIKESLEVKKDEIDVTEALHLIKEVPTLNYGNVTVFIETKTTMLKLNKSTSLAEMIIKNFQIFDLMPDELLDIFATYQRNIKLEKEQTSNK